MAYVYLNVHSEYSICDSLIRLDDLINFCQKEAMPAVALTDQMNLFGLIKFYQAAQRQRIKPIIGADLLIHNAHFPRQNFRMIALCKNQAGYDLLKRLISKAYLEGHGTADGKAIDQQWLVEASSSKGLILIAPLLFSDLYHYWLQNKMTALKEKIMFWQSYFKDDYFVEISRINHEKEWPFNQCLLELANTLDLPLVASNAPRFVKAEDFEAHEARVCIHQGHVLADKNRSRVYTEEQYLKPVQEIEALFKFCPAALENSVQIAYRCNVKLEFGKVFLPPFETPNQIDIQAYLRQEAKAGLAARLVSWSHANKKPDLDEQVYYARLDLELGVINNMGFAGYFLIVSDFIQWAKKQKIPVGPGRGSGAGSLVAYALGITNLDPLIYDLLFERFLNPERISLPDFDIDFCMEKRDQVIEYVSNKYGKQAVSQIITFGTMAAKAVVRDVGRVLGQPYGLVDKLAKLIPLELGMTLKLAMEQEPLLKQKYEQEEEVRILLDLALKLEGITRSVGKHAGGVVIAPGNLNAFTPLYAESEDAGIVSQFDKDDVEAIGLVKFDFLGLRTLTIIDWAVRSINAGKKPGSELDLDQIPLDDPATFELLRRGETAAIFQIESRGMKEMIVRLKPDTFEDLIALVALYRPGPLQSGMVDDFINRKQGLAAIEDLHPDIAQVLKPTYGIILYQEQVMQIAQVLAGYSLGSADLLRRAMGKKKAEEMAEQRAIFVTGALQRGIQEETAAYIFDLMEKFAGYGFNKSHSAAYAVLTYQTAWLKAHHPGAFMAAVLSADMNHTEKVAGFIEEVQRMGLRILSPHVNQSDYYFAFDVDQNVLLYGLGAVKGMGEAAIENIQTTRKKSGPFTSLLDFCQRVDLRKVTKRALEALIKSGAFDGLIEHRAWGMANLDVAQQAAQQVANRLQRGQGDLFLDPDGFDPATQSAHHNQLEIKTKSALNWDTEQALKFEKEVLGFYLSGHPIQPYEEELKQLKVTSLKKMNWVAGPVRIAGFIHDMRTKMNSRHKKMGLVHFDDGSTRIEIVFFAEDYQKFFQKLIKDTLLILDVELVKNFSGQLRIKVKHVYDLWEARRLFSRFIRIQMKSGESVNQNPRLAEELLSIIKQNTDPEKTQANQPNQQLFLEYWVDREEKPVRLKLTGCHFRLNHEGIQALRAVESVETVDLLY